jgi:GYF domain 2
MLTDDPVLNQLLLASAMGVVTGAMCALMARRAGRRPFFWFMVGFLSGLVGLLALFFVTRRYPVQEKKDKAPPPPSPWESNHWYFLDRNRMRQGPFSLRQLTSAARDGEVKHESWVWNERLESWQRVHQLDGLSTELKLN